MKTVFENEPVDKVERKFKVGDFIANDYCVGKVIALTDDAYLLDTGQGIPFSCEHNAHLWTIQDAKDGDVLCSNQIIVLFRQWEDNTDYGFVIAHAGIDISGKLQITNGHWLISNKSKPATKEQRDLLFQKMHEAGYEWNAEKKELKKISQEYPLTPDECIKSAWSEEDEKMCQETIDWFEKKCFPYALESENPARESINWLKSLRHQATWKPSDEQMEILKELVEDSNQRYFYTILKSLYEQLKNLRDG